MFAHFLFQIFAEGGADRVPLAVSSSIEATQIFCPVLKFAGRSTTFVPRRILQPLSGYRVHVQGNDQGWSEICRFAVHDESSARKKESLSAFCLWLNASPIIRYSSIRSSRRPGSRRRNLLYYTPASPRLRQGFIFTLLYLNRKWIMN